MRGLGLTLRAARLSLYYPVDFAVFLLPLTDRRGSRL